MPPKYYDSLLKEAANTWSGSAGLTSGKVTMDDIGYKVAAAAKMGFRTLEEAEAFGELKDASDPKVKGFLDKVSNLAVPAKGNPPKMLMTKDHKPIDSPYDPVMAAFGDKYRGDHGILKKLSDDFKDNPAIEGQLLQAIKNHPKEAAQAIRVYNGSEKLGDPGRLETLVGRINKLSPIATVAGVGTGNTGGNKSVDEPKDPSPRGSGKVSGGRVADKPSPASVVAGAAVDAPPTAQQSTPTPLAPAASVTAPTTTGSMPKMKASDVAAIADPLADKFKQLAPDTVGIEEFRNTLKTDKNLQARIAENFNNNPEFVEQMKKMFAQSENGQESANDKLMKQYGRPTIAEIVGNPSKLADDSYVDGLTSKLGGASGGLSDMMSKLGDMFGGMDLGALFQPLAELCQKAFAALKECFSGENMLAMKNGASDLFGDLMGKDGALASLTGQPGTDQRPQYVDKNTGNMEDPEIDNDRKRAPAPEQNIRMANQQAAPMPAGGNPAPPTVGAV